jgi:hypothetical protein
MVLIIYPEIFDKRAAELDKILAVQKNSNVENTWSKIKR